MHGTGINLFGSSLSSQSAFPALSQSQSGQASAASPFGQAIAPSSSSPLWPSASSASGVASTLGSFGFGQSSSSASQRSSSESAASPFEIKKGWSFGNLSLASSSAAAAPTSSFGGVGGFRQQGFAGFQASGVIMLLQFVSKCKFTITTMSTLLSYQQHTDEMYHNSYDDESSRMHACLCFTFSAQPSLAETLNGFLVCRCYHRYPCGRLWANIHPHLPF